MTYVFTTVKLAGTDPGFEFRDGALIELNAVQSNVKTIRDETCDEKLRFHANIFFLTDV